MIANPRLSAVDRGLTGKNMSIAWFFSGVTVPPPGSYPTNFGGERKPPPFDTITKPSRLSVSEINARRAEYESNVYLPRTTRMMISRMMKIFKRREPTTFDSKHK